MFLSSLQGLQPLAASFSRCSYCPVLSSKLLQASDLKLPRKQHEQGLVCHKVRSCYLLLIYNLDDIWIYIYIKIYTWYIYIFIYINVTIYIYDIYICPYIYVYIRYDIYIYDTYIWYDMIYIYIYTYYIYIWYIYIWYIHTIWYDIYTYIFDIYICMYDTYIWYEKYKYDIYIYAVDIHAHIYIYHVLFRYDICIYDRRKFRSQTFNNMDRWKAEQGRGREKRKIRREKSRREKSKKKEDGDARKGRKVAKHCVFPMIWGSGGSKSRLAKAAGAEPAGQMRDEKLHAVVARSTFPSQNVQSTPLSDHFWSCHVEKGARRCGREAHFQVKMYKTPQLRTTFGSCHVEKVHAVVARSTFPSQNVQNTSAPDHFWKLSCGKSARRCGREAHFQVKMYKTPHVRATFGGSDVEKVHVVVARSTFPSQNVQSTTCSRHFWRFGCWKSARRCGAKHIWKSTC